MKTEDIEVGTEYALGSENTLDGRYARRAVVLEKGVERHIKPKDRRTFRRVVFDGIEIQYVDSAGHLGKTAVIPPSYVGMTWEAYEEQGAKRDAERAGEQERRKAQLVEAWGRVRDCVPDSIEIPEVPDEVRFGDSRIYLSPARLVEIVEAAYEFGRKAP